MLVRSVNKLSNNFMAEQVLKLIDTADGNREPASSAGGAARVRAHLESLGIDVRSDEEFRALMESHGIAL